MPFSHNRAFDEKHGYRAKSMLVVPMIDHRDRVVGVLQLINRKRGANAKIRTDADSDEWVLPYTEREVAIVSSLAGQAAVSIENGQLYQDIENLFAGFIKTAVTAIDRRDPTTSGHSVRVTELTCDVAELIAAQTAGPFADVHFSEADMKQLRYAGLLHDFGKVGVSEETLIKKNKLPPVLEERVEARFGLIRKTLEADAASAKADVIGEKGRQGAAADLAAIDAEVAEALERLAHYRDAVQDANIPRVLDEEAAEVLEEIARHTFIDPDGKEQAYLTPHELHFLQIRRGSLDENERRQIQAHVVHSYDFLLNIPWTEELARIAEIVRGHHEKLDGSGYPDGVTGDQLSLETRIMTVCDIFDALTASDRPYKKAMPVEKALQVLQWEAKDGMLDKDIVELFVQSGVYKKVLERDWREF
jgi:HD-GYP domain-containing protein (c-di-GMP phosphodiesterase class II)